MRRDKNRGEVPAPLLRLKQKFTEWRNCRTAGQRIPRPLWNSAAKLAARHGLSQTATVLGLDYYSLKRHVERERSINRILQVVAWDVIAATVSFQRQSPHDIEFAVTGLFGVLQTVAQV